MVLILECRSHLDLGDLPNLLAAELGVMTVRLERAIRSVDGVARVHVNRWGDGSAHLQMWFLARPYGRLQLRGTFLSLWNDILPVVPEEKWRESLAHVAAWLGEFGGRAIAEPPHIHWQAPATFSEAGGSTPPAETDADPVADLAADTAGPVETFDDGGMRDLAAYAKQDAHPLHPTTTTPTATTRAEPGPPAFEPIGTARTEPFGTESVGTESAATEPAATGPVGTESVGTESAATGSVGIESVGTESVEIAPAATEPIATEAAVTVVAAIGPCATGLVGADPSEPDR
ncbi:hypothetical protein AB0M36_19455 [Actinoplanes sp. NPDC051346]|uniref:hypothetical protein n=1 Tax=Actinoplanes sp. NPDC051346 TaxID=3155048 RepID=UPI003424D335